MSDPTFDNTETANLPRVGAADPLSDTAVLGPLRGMPAAGPQPAPAPGPGPVPVPGAWEPTAPTTGTWEPPPPGSGAWPPAGPTAGAWAPAAPGTGPAQPVAPGTVPPEPAGPPEPATPQAGWWRRNRWGLVALLPALALALGPPAKDAYDQITGLEPSRPVTAGADGWTEYAGARMRLVELTDATTEVTAARRPVRLPPGVRVWRARLGFESAETERIGGCKLLLESLDGRTFGADPDELDEASLYSNFCTPGLEKPGPAYETQSYFVLPTSAQPTAVRVVLSVESPRYARLSPG
ncbi:hypothetical protein AB0J86_00420 [Micromonospora sp. NPDC049559]|uniref:hypothetical protein n=1 Tax=Micromonospora sp. NPDC049559 TaxID=3155923 RepID=UPI003436C6B7